MGYGVFGALSFLVLGLAVLVACVIAGHASRYRSYVFLASLVVAYTLAEWWRTYVLNQGIVQFLILVLAFWACSARAWRTGRAAAGAASSARSRRRLPGENRRQLLGRPDRPRRTRANAAAAPPLRARAAGSRVSALEDADVRPLRREIGRRDDRQPAVGVLRDLVPLAEARVAGREEQQPEGRVLEVRDELGERQLRMEQDVRGQRARRRPDRRGTRRAARAPPPLRGSRSRRAARRLRTPRPARAP